MTRWWKALPLTVGLVLCSTVGCESELDEVHFQRKAEKIFMEVNPGFGILRRKNMKSTFVRGDQVYQLDIAPLFTAYASKGKKTSEYFDAWRKKIEAETAARKRTLEQAKDTIIPIFKSGKWIRVQDLGAIGSARVQDKIRPWRKEVAKDVFVLIGVPEELLGYRYVSIQEMADSKGEADEWLNQAIQNNVKKVGTSTGSELRGKKGNLLVWDVVEVDGVASLILDPRFRKTMLTKFQLPELGASIPNRDILIVFDPSDFVTKKPIRARTHQLYDVRNHPGFRGLLQFDTDTLSVLEGPNPEKKKRGR